MDKHFKRNKDKYNPYTLLSNKDKNIYVVVFKDNRNKTHNIEVSKDIYNDFDKLELEDISQMHKYERHIQHSEVYEETIYSRSINKQTSLEEEVERKILYENIRTAMNKLTETQRRIKLYFFENMNFTQIVRLEKCDESSVRESIYDGIEKLKIFKLILHKTDFK